MGHGKRSTYKNGDWGMVYMALLKKKMHQKKSYLTELFGDCLRCTKAIPYEG